jgi:hypothetical protein
MPVILVDTEELYAHINLIVGQAVTKAMETKPIRTFTIKQVKEMLHMSNTTLHRRRKDGTLVPIRDKGKVVFSEEEVKRYLARK